MHSSNVALTLNGMELSMQFLNRDTEKAILKMELEKRDSRFIVLYGRRRIGKSALLQHLLGPDSVYFLADINEAEVQRAFFASQLARLIPRFERLTYPDWYSLFEQANRLLSKRITIVIDEFPYLVKSSPELPSVLQKLIDLKQNSMFHLVLCGSYQQMMQGLVLDRTAPLFGRAHRIMQLKPMSCGWLRQALELTPMQAIEEYAVWGGVPRNWELRSEYSDLWTAIRELILDPWGILHEEPLRLFMDDLNNAVQPISIASLIGQGCNKLSEISARLNKPATNLNRPLQSMIDTGYVKRDVCWGESARASKKTLYRLQDPISKFYFSFIEPNKSRLGSRHIDQVAAEIKKRWSIFVSETWEELSRESISSFQVEDQSFNPAQRWWSQSKLHAQAEIDIVSESVDGSCLIIGEAKWQKQIDPQKLIRDLDKKLEIMALKKSYRKIYRLLMAPNAQELSEGCIMIRNAGYICPKQV